MANKILYNESSAAYIYNWGFPPDKFGMVVTAASGRSIELTSIKLMLSNHRQPGGSFVVNIYNVDGSNNPTGSVLATASILGTNVNPVYDVNTFGWYIEESLYEFTFDSSVTIGPGEKCAIMFVQPYVLGIFTTQKSIAFAFEFNGAITGSDFDTTFIRRYDDDGGGWFDVSLFIPHFQLYGNVTSAPTKATNPTPNDTADDTDRDLTTITWEDGGGADTYNVYYGTESGNLTLVSATQAGTSFTVWGVEHGSPYGYEKIRYWRIDSTNVAGTTTGDEWSFTTVSEGYEEDWPDPRPDPNGPDPGTGGGRFNIQLLVIGHKVLYYSEV